MSQPEHCHVVFVKSVSFRPLASSPSADPDETSFPDLRHDPFTPSNPAASTSAASTTRLSGKPQAPPTPALVELPTCPVCLERMDESTGLLTILCQHVFHCTCLQKWRGGGCPVCRYTQDKRFPLASPTATGDADGEPLLNECRVCRADTNLWICLICGRVGCGRYDAAHAFAHHEATGHRFALDLATQRVWDYDADGYVHRILQSMPDGKLVSLPHANEPYPDTHGTGAGGAGADDMDAVPRAKLDAMAQEYAGLLTSQLDSQRAYFEQQLALASDKAAAAAASAASAADAAASAQAQLATLQAQHDEAVASRVPGLERERERAARRAERFEGMARKLEKEWREEKSVGAGLMERIEWLEGEVKGLRVKEEELREENRDLKFFVSGGEKLRELGMGEEVEEAKVSVGEGKEEKGRRKGKGKKVAGSAG